MTAAWLSIAVLIGVVLGSKFGGLDHQKPLWWRIGTSLLLAAVVLVGMGIPVAGRFSSASMVQVAAGEGTLVNLHLFPQGDRLVDGAGGEGEVDLSGLSGSDRSDIRESESVILRVSPAGEGWRAENVVWIDPPVTFPLIPALHERARNVFFHVPAAWVASVAWFVAAFFALRFLRRRHPEDDIRSSSTAAVGLLFCVTATISGSIWSRFDWGSFWNWDPRQISIVVVLMIFGAYFALRSALDSSEQRARISAVYVLMMVLPVLFFIGVFPRLMESLHPNNLELNRPMAVLFPVAALAMTLLYYWIANVTTRLKLLRFRRERHAIGIPDDATVVEPLRPVAIHPKPERLNR